MVVRGLPLVTFVSAFALLALPGAAQGPVDPAIHALFLTDHDLPDRSELTCPGTRAYGMDDDATQVVEGVAPASTSGPVIESSCPTYFVYTAPITFQLGATVHIVLVLRCDPATVYAPVNQVLPPELADPDYYGVKALLTRDPSGRAQTQPNLAPDPDMVFFNEPPALCAADEATFTLEGDLPAHNATLEAGDPLTLVLWTRYTSPSPGDAPLVSYVAGPGQSRLESPAFPAPGANGGVAAVDSRARMFLHADVLDPFENGVCAADSVYGARDLPAESEGQAAASLSTPGIACETIFRYTITRQASLHGPTTLDLWFRCDQPSTGLAATFTAQLKRVSGTGERSDVGHQAVATGGQLGVCPATAAVTQLQGLVDPPVLVFPDDWLEVWVYTYYASVPSLEPTAGFVHYLVGPSFPSALAIHGLDGLAHTEPVRNGTSLATGSPGDVLPAAPGDDHAGALHGAPMSGWASAGALVVALAVRRRSHRRND